MPSRSAGLTCPRTGSQMTDPFRGCVPDDDERTSRMVSCPPDCSAGTRAEPIRPVEPEIRIFIALPPEWRYLPRAGMDCSAELRVRGRNARASRVMLGQADPGTQITGALIDSRSDRPEQNV